MASNDLMMRIQLLVESGRASKELKQIEKALNDLRKQISVLETTRLAPLTKQIDDLRKSSAQLKTVDLNNFVNQIGKIRTEMAALGVNVRPLDDLSKAFTNLQNLKAANQIGKLKTQLQGVNSELQKAQRLTLTGPGQTANQTFQRLNADLKQYDTLIRNATGSLINQQRAILNIKNTLSTLPKVKFDPSFLATIKEIRTGKNQFGEWFKIKDAKVAINSLKDFNAQLDKQTQGFIKNQANAANYSQQIAKLRLEMQRLAVPDFKSAGRDLFGDLQKQKTNLQNLRTQGIVPLQSEIRKLAAQRSLDKALQIDKVAANLRTSRAQLALWKNEYNALSKKDQAGLSTAQIARLNLLAEQIPKLTERILKSDLDLARSQQSLVSGYNKTLAEKKKSLAEQKAIESATANEIRGINQLINSQRQLARQAAESVKTRKGGLFDTQAAKLQAQQLADTYKGNIKSLKDFYSERQKAAKADSDLVRKQLQDEQQKLAAGRLTQAQYKSIRDNIRALITAEKDRSKVYQQTLKDQRKNIQENIKAENEKERSLLRQISALRQQASAQAQLRSVQLRGDLGNVRGNIKSLQEQIRLNEAAARSEIQRIKSLDDGSKAAARQSKQLTTLGQLFRGNVGIVKEFGSALRFALGPQMAGFAAAGSIIQLISGFFAANKEIENLNRGLNALSGSGTLYFEELRRIANTTGQSIQTITSSYLQLVAASKGTRLEGEATRKIFEAVSRALVITGADTVRSQRAFLALAQIMSKGQVYAEELRQQLSEALPGAVQVFSRALEISPQKMLELMKEGKVSSDSLLLFAMQLEKEYAILGEDMFTFSQKAAVLQNELQRLFLEIGKTGVWQAFGDALIFVRDLVRETADGVGTFGDTVTREFGAVKASFQTLDFPDLSKNIDLFIDSLSGFSLNIINDFLRLLRQIPKEINDIDFLVSQFGTRLQARGASATQESTNWLLELDRRFGTTYEDINGYLASFNRLISSPVPAPDFSKWQQQEGANFTIRISELRSELEKLTKLQETGASRGISVDDARYQKVAKRIAEINEELRVLVTEQDRAFKQSVDNIKAQNNALDKNYETLQKQNKAYKEIEQNNKFISGFSPRARSALNGAYETLKNYQRTSETLLRLEKESEQAMVNKANAAKRTLDLINEIYDAEQRGRQAQEGYDKDKANDESEKLKFKLSAIEQIRQAEENARKLRQGRAEAGIYFTDDQRQASQDEAQAYKLRVQAAEELAKATKETNRETKNGYLENAKFLLEQANELYVAAGNTYLLKQNNEELVSIYDQLSKSTQNQINKDRERANGLRLQAQAQSLVEQAFKPEIAAPVRDALLNQADELAKKAQAIFADINFSKGLEDTKGLRTNIANTLENAAGELQNKIDAAITKFNAANQGNLEQVATALADASTLAVSLQNELINKILGATTEAGRNQLLAELTRVQNEFRTLEKEYDQVNKRLEDAGKKPIKVPFIIDPTYMTFGESMSNQINGVKEDVTTLDSEIGKDVPKKIVLNIDEALKQHEALTAILSTPITRTVIYKAIGDIPSGGTNTQVTGSTGGYLPGYGGGDRIRALLEPGEFVLRKEAVRSIGLDQLVALNRQRVPRLSDSITVPRMAAGGAVTGAPIVINVPGQKPIRLSGSRDQAVALANLLTSVGRAA